MLEKLINKAYKKGKLSALSLIIENELGDAVMDSLEGLVCEINVDEAEEIVRAMRPFGEKWPRAEVRSFIAGKGVAEEHCLHYYLVMNMMYNDHHESGRKYGMDRADFYFDLSKEFIEDPDARPHKIERYFED